ncbi:MAG: phosphopantothenoylcysteine decarboxylase, partial [[Clostridium] cellulosi]
MNVLITAGGTTENIDPVRKIKNTATGRLGSLIAEEFV